MICLSSKSWTSLVSFFSDLPMQAMRLTKMSDYNKAYKRSTPLNKRKPLKLCMNRFFKNYCSPMHLRYDWPEAGTAITSHWHQYVLLLWMLWGNDILVMRIEEGKVEATSQTNHMYLIYCLKLSLLFHACQNESAHKPDGLRMCREKSDDLWRKEKGLTGGTYLWTHLAWCPTSSQKK